MEIVQNREKIERRRGECSMGQTNANSDCIDYGVWCY